MNHTYYVVFEASTVNGGITVTMPEKISQDNIDELRTKIEEIAKDDRALITNWILLDGPEYPNDTKKAILEFSALVKGKLLSILNDSEGNSEKKKALTLALNSVLAAEREYL